LASSSVLPNLPEAAAQPATATTNSPNKTLLLLIYVSRRGTSPPHGSLASVHSAENSAPGALTLISPFGTLPFEPYKCTADNDFCYFGNTFCLFLHPAEIAVAHKITDIRPLTTLVSHYVC
jgi:hypothetical protein